MLIELNITNFAIIDSLRLSLGSHLNVFTGETGAGKSILVDAVSALVGERTGTEVVRAGSERAIIEGIFDVASLLAPSVAGGLDGHARTNVQDGTEEKEDTEPASLSELLAELSLELEDGTLILAREVLASGRSIARVNGRGVPLSSLQRIARFLVDIHGQSAHLALLRPEQHVYYLDRYANTTDAREQVAALVAQWRAERRELERLRRDEREIERRVELLRYQVEEIEAARLQPDELNDLETERRRLANAERLGELCAAAHAALAGDPEGDTLGALDLLAQAQRSLADLHRLDDGLAASEETLEQALFLAQDVASAITSYQDEIAADPQRQMVVEERLDLIAKLRRKYGATIAEILAYAAEAGRELDELTHREERIGELQERDRVLRERIGARAGELSRKRQAAALVLAVAMERELDDLNMRRARFQIQIAQTPSADGVPVELAADERTRRDDKRVEAETRYAFGPTGIDHVEFMIATNPGEPVKPLAKIASGGETSRLMLALKTILSRADIVPILIFDEIDAGISGRSGQTVGEKLWQLGQSHQVLCVTHLPQIAALGDCHFRVAKEIRGERTTTSVQSLDHDERIVELSQMLGGARTAAAEANADELLARAHAWKRDGIVCTGA
ncbi:MAG: DNA repair protein RecN [Ktedonobacterales bacterium]